MKDQASYIWARWINDEWMPLYAYSHLGEWVTSMSAPTMHTRGWFGSDLRTL